MKKFIERIKNIVNFIKQLSLKKKIIVSAVFILTAALLRLFVFNTQTNEVTYEKATVIKGTLLTSISGSGTITSVNSTNISSKVSGVVKEVYVSDGDIVTKGQKIALIELDEYALERQAQSWASYLSAQEAVKTAEKDKASTDIAMWEAREAIIKAEEDIEYKNTNSINPKTKEEYTLSERTIIDKSLEKANLAYAEAEAKYKNADTQIKTARTKVTSALRDYQINSSTILAPVAGAISNLNLAAGMTITSTSNSNNSANENSVSATASQTFGKVSDPDGSLLATISLSEIDVINVKSNQKVTLIFDAYDDKTFTGKVLAVDTDGNSNSGVTSYSVTIILDPVEVEVYPSMAITADIITDIQTDVLLLPTTAVQTLNQQAYVQVLKDGVLTSVLIEVGNTNDFYTVIKSGLNEGDEVITSVTFTKEKDDDSSSSETSPFSGLGNSGTSTRNNTGGMGVMTGGMGGGTPPGGM